MDNLAQARATFFESVRDITDPSMSDILRGKEIVDDVAVSEIRAFLDGASGLIAVNDAAVWYRMIEYPDTYPVVTMMTPNRAKRLIRRTLSRSGFVRKSGIYWNREGTE